MDLNTQKPLKYQENSRQYLPRKPRKYSKISKENRQVLVQMVFEEGCSIFEVAKTLDIKYTTAKAIAKKYEKTGIIGRINSSESIQTKKQHKNVKKNARTVNEVKRQRNNDSVLNIEDTNNPCFNYFMTFVGSELFHYDMCHYNTRNKFFGTTIVHHPHMQ